MRIDRIRLKDFAGVVEREIRFAPKGVTIVHGPNEVGKSTLMQAINVLFDHRDDSRKEEVRVTKPVNRDVGSEVEAEVEVGVYRFTYFKRFHKDRETRLTVQAPKPENLTGREAHDRVQQILAGSLDAGLWKALRIVQGVNMILPELGAQPALARALDQAAGQAQSGDREEALIGAAHTEYLAYFTERGKEREDPIGEARAKAAAGLERVQELQSALAELENDVARHAAVGREWSNLQAHLPELQSSFEKAERVAAAVAKLNDEMERRRSAFQLAESAVTVAKNASEQRAKIVADAAQAGQRVQDILAEQEQLHLDLQRALDALVLARDKRATIASAADEAEKQVSLLRADHDFRRDELDLAQMDARLDRVRTAERAAAAAAEIISSTRTTETLRQELRAAEVKVGTTRGILESAAPQLHIKAMRAVSVTIGTGTERLESGDKRSIVVGETVTARFGDAVEIRAEPGASAETLQQNVQSAERALKQLCERVGVSSVAEAEEAWTRLQDAKRAVDDRDRVFKENLRDLSRPDLEGRANSTRVRVKAYPTARVESPPMPPALDQAKNLLTLAEQAAAETRAAARLADEAVTESNVGHSALREQAAGKSALLDQTRKDQEALSARVAEARGSQLDQAIAEAYSAAHDAMVVAQGALSDAQAALRNSDPEVTNQKARSAAQALTNVKSNLAAQQQELTQLVARLEAKGEKGLAEAVDEAQRASYEAKDSLERLARRAAGSRLLFETLRLESDASRCAYVAPLREGIERLGRHVFGPTVRVEVDESLRVVNRTVNGETIRFDQLSTGAKEQIGLLVRLAAAQIVSGDGGAPLVLDDALVATDDVRLEAIGNVLSVASQGMQTIVLTCSPDRYIHVGAEALVPL